MAKTLASANPLAHPHLDHLFKLGVLVARSGNRRLSRATRTEAAAEVLRYRDEGLITQKFGKEKPVAKRRVYTGRGVLFAVIDDRERMGPGKVTTVDIITEAIEAALDAGNETSEEIARYITTSAFQHEPDRRVRFNSVLKASDATGAQITRKLYNAYNELAKLADEEEDPKVKADLKSEAHGFAAAIQIVISPFSSEDSIDPRLVNWDEVDRMTDNFEKEQRLVRRERKGNPQ
ncbi:hypothetical protein SEA_JEMERALD_45 [Microbacterium phage Jemerald]|nr:hypothetical protein SEA_JUICER_45 [Microbacterium phage Juicer]WNO27284.1 hypothetical protein SEA_JEMERALD_45 [Microbacterium phage Jemerald]